MARQLALNPRQRLEARRMREDGATYREIGDHFRISHNSVVRNLDPSDTRKKRAAIPVEVVERIVGLKNGGFRTMEVCDLLKVNRWCVARAMRLSDPRVNDAREQCVAPDFKPKSIAWAWDRTATEPEANAAEW